MTIAPSTEGVVALMLKKREDAIEAIAAELRSAAFDGRTVEDPRVAAEGLLESGVVVLAFDRDAEVEGLRALIAEYMAAEEWNTVREIDRRAALMLKVDSEVGE